MLGLELAIGYGVKLAVTGGLYYYVRSSLREVEAPALRAWLVDQGGPLPATPADVARAEDEAYREQSVESSSSGDEAAPGDPATEQEEPCEGPLQLVDVRTQYEFDAGHIDGSLLVSLVPPWSIKQRLCECISRANSIVVVDYNGLRSMAIVKMLRDDGYCAMQLKGGLVEWRRAGLPEVGTAPGVAVVPVEAEADAVTAVEAPPMQGMLISFDEPPAAASQGDLIKFD